MTIENSEGYAIFLTILKWTDETWDNNIQAGQKWWKEKLGCSLRTIKRYYAQARKDGIIETLRRWRRTSIIYVFGGRHQPPGSAQMTLDLVTPGTLHQFPQNQQVADPCPHNVPTVVSSTSFSKEAVVSKASSTVLDRLRAKFPGFFKKERDEPRERLRATLETEDLAHETPAPQRDPWELRQERAERERKAIEKLSPESRSKLGLAPIDKLAADLKAAIG